MSQALGSRADTSNVPAKTGKPAKEPSAKNALPSTIMEESEDDAPKRAQTKATSVPAGENEASKAPAGEKKKKRKLGALLGATTFTWDQTLVRLADHQVLHSV